MTTTEGVGVAIVLAGLVALVLGGWWRDRHVRLLRRVCDRFARDLEAAYRAGDLERADVLRGMFHIAQEAYVAALLRRR